MAQAMLDKKRSMDIEEVAVVPEKTRKMDEDDDNARADLENITLFASVIINTPDKKKGISKADFVDRPPRAEPIKRPEDDRTQTLSGFHLMYGDDSYILPLDTLCKWRVYDCGSRRIFCPIPLLKHAMDMSNEHDLELSRGVDKKDTVYPPEQINSLRAAFLSEEGREMCKSAGES
jgi:hypothetical protein